MSTMDDLVTWLRAQIDEDERVARHAGDVRPVWVYDREKFRVLTADGQKALVTVDGTPLPDQWIVAAGTPAQPFLDVNGAHLARFDPARVLREVEAKRLIVSEWEKADEAAAMDASEVSARVAKFAFGLSLGALAGAYADRPGYREEWRP